MREQKSGSIPDLRFSSGRIVLLVRQNILARNNVRTQRNGTQIFYRSVTKPFEGVFSIHIQT